MVKKNLNTQVVVYKDYQKSTTIFGFMRFGGNDVAMVSNEIPTVRYAHFAAHLFSLKTVHRPKDEWVAGY